MKLSIIIPVYNTEKYLERCLNSCIRQDLAATEYELVIINDGSTDNSLAIVEQYASSHTNIKCFSQNNCGLSMARNNGLDQSRGEYIMFLDSDDWIENNCLRRILDLCHNQDLDLLRIAAANVKEDKVTRRYTLKENIISTGAELLKEGLDFCVPFTIYKRRFLDEHKLRFMPGVFHEDNEFTPRVYYYAERVGCLNELIYFVYQSPNSITRSINPKKAYDSILVSESLNSFCDGVDKNSKSTFHNIIGSTLNVSLHNSLLMSDNELCNYKIFLREHRTVFSHLLHCSSLKYRIEGLLFLLFSQNIPLIYKMLLKFDYRKYE